MFGSLGRAMGGAFGAAKPSMTPLQTLLMQRQGGGMMGNMGSMGSAMGGGVTAGMPYNTGIMKPGGMGKIEQMPTEAPIASTMPVNEGGGAIDEQGNDMPARDSQMGAIGRAGSAIGSMMGGMGKKTAFNRRGF